MINRKQKVQELLVDLQSLKRAIGFHARPHAHMPRITPSQWGVLAFVKHREKSTVKDIAAALGMTSSAATQLVDGLVESGYVIRKINPKDRRAVTIMLSGKTKKQVEKMKDMMLEKALRFFKALNDKEFEQYIALNKKIVQGFLAKKDL